MEHIERPSVNSVLQASTFLNALAEDEIDSIGTSSRLKSAERGDYIWIAGNEVDFFGLVGTGFVKMVRSTGDGADVTLEIMGPGQIFGLMGTIEGSGCPLSAVAVTDLWYLRIPKALFLPIYKRNNDLKDGLVRRSAVRLHGAVDLIARMSTGRIEERIAAILFILAESYGERIDGALRLAIPLTRQEIAEMAGTTVETTIRTLSKWQKQGIVRTERSHITVLDENALSGVLRF